MGNETLVNLNLEKAELEMLETMKGPNEQVSDVVTRIIKENIEAAHSPECTPFLILNSDLQLLAEQAVKANKTAEMYFHELIKEGGSAAKCKMAVEVLELVWSQLNDNDSSMSALRTEIAGDLLVSRITLEIATKGTIEPEQIKKWAEELYT